MPQTIMTDDGKYVAGMFDPVLNVFTKTVRHSRHWLRQPGAWCIDEGVVNGLPDDCIILVIDLEDMSGDMQWCNVDEIRQACFVRNMKAGRQYIITDRFWRITDNVHTVREPDPGIA